MRENTAMLRDLATVGLTWAVLWMGVWLALSSIVGLVDPLSIDAGEGPADLVLQFGLAGLAVGLAFGGLLALVEWRRTFAAIPLMRAAIVGVLVSAPVPVLLGADTSQSLLAGALGAISGLLSMAIVRRASERRVSEELQSGH